MSHRSSAVEPAVRVGVIGFGEMGAVHCLALAQSREFVLTAGCDPDPARRAALAATFPAVRTYANHESLLHEEDLDLVIVASPPAAHRATVEAAIEQGVHVLCEKPLAPTLEEAEEMARATEGKASHCFVNLQLRFALGRVRVRDLIAEGAIGQVIGARASFSLPGFEESAPAWFARRELGGGVLMEFGSHHIDQLRWLLGGVSRASGFGDVARHDDNATHAVAVLLFASGSIGEIAVSTRVRFVPRRLLEVYGERGTLRLEDDERLFLVDHSGTSTAIVLPFEEFDSLTGNPLERFTRPLQHMFRHLAGVLRASAPPGDLATFADAVAVQAVIQQIEGPMQAELR